MFDLVPTKLKALWAEFLNTYHQIVLYELKIHYDADIFEQNILIGLVLHTVATLQIRQSSA